MLHITNGDCAAERIRAAGVEGTILPWRDVLHEGPVPAGLPLERLSAVRADFLASGGAGAADEVRRSFAERDRILTASRGEELSMPQLAEEFKQTREATRALLSELQQKGVELTDTRSHT